MEILTGDKEYWINRLSKAAKNNVSFKNIKDSSINITVPLQLYQSPDIVSPSHSSLSSLEKLKLDKELVVETPFEVLNYLVDTLDRTVKIIKTDRTEPIIRMWAVLTGFCTMWEKSNSGDLPQLELLERSQLIQLVNLGCEFRSLINLDMMLAKSVGFKKAEMINRVSDLCQICDLFAEKKNFKIAVESTCLTNRNLVIFGNSLERHTINFVNRSNNDLARWHSSEEVIYNTSLDFDKHFFAAQSQNNLIKEALKLKSNSELVNYYFLERLKDVPDWS